MSITTGSVPQNLRPLNNSRKKPKAKRKPKNKDKAKTR